MNILGTLLPRIRDQQRMAVEEFSMWLFNADITHLSSEEQDTLQQIVDNLLETLDRSYVWNVIYQLAEISVGARILYQVGAVRRLAELFTSEVQQLRSDSLLLYSHMLHCAATRNAFAQQTVQNHTDPLLVKFLEDLAGPEKILFGPGLLALNWFAGSDVGALCMLQHLPTLRQAYLNCQGQRGEISLLLTIANLPAFLCHRPRAIRKFLDADFLPLLLEALRTEDVSRGFVGVVMALANLPEPKDSPHPLMAPREPVVRSLMEGLDCAVANRPHGLILWSPWQLLQAIGNLLVLNPVGYLRLVPVDKLIDFIIGILLAVNPMGLQSEPIRDEAHAARVLYLLLDQGTDLRVYAVQLSGVFRAILSSESKHAPMCKWYISLCAEVLNTPHVFLSLQQYCRRSIIQSSIAAATARGVGLAQLRDLVMPDNVGGAAAAAAPGTSSDVVPSRMEVRRRLFQRRFPHLAHQLQSFLAYDITAASRSIYYDAISPVSKPDLSARMVGGVHVSMPTSSASEEDDVAAAASA